MTATDTTTDAPPLTMARLDELGPEWPIGLSEIRTALNVPRSTIDMWRYRHELPAEEVTTIGGRAFWRWGVIRQWALDTGRLIIEHDEETGEPLPAPLPRGRKAHAATAAGREKLAKRAAAEDKTPDTAADIPAPAAELLDLPAAPELPEGPLPAAEVDEAGALLDPFAEKLAQ